MNTQATASSSTTGATPTSSAKPATQQPPGNGNRTSQPAGNSTLGRAPTGQRHTGIDSLLTQLRATPSVEERANMALQALEDQYRGAGGDPEKHTSYMAALHENRAKIAQAIAG